MDRERMYRFLTGLNEEYDGLRSQLLSRSPPPTLNEACVAVQHEEMRRHAMRCPTRVENAAIGETQSFVRPARLQSEHCKKTVHTKDRCLELVRRPSVGKNKSKRKTKQTSSQTFISSAVGPGVLTEEEVQAFRRLMSSLSSSSTRSATTLESTGAGDRKSDWIWDDA